MYIIIYLSGYIQRDRGEVAASTLLHSLGGARCPDGTSPHRLGCLRGSPSHAPPNKQLNFFYYVTQIRYSAANKLMQNYLVVV